MIIFLPNKQLDGSHQVYGKILDFLHSPEDDTPDLTDLVLHDVMSELDFFRGQKYKPEIANFGKYAFHCVMQMILRYIQTNRFDDLM